MNTDVGGFGRYYNTSRKRDRYEDFTRRIIGGKSEKNRANFVANRRPSDVARIVFGEYGFTRASDNRTRVLFSTSKWGPARI